MVKPIKVLLSRVSAPAHPFSLAGRAAADAASLYTRDKGRLEMAGAFDLEADAHRLTATLRWRTMEVQCVEFWGPGDDLELLGRYMGDKLVRLMMEAGL